MNTRSALEVALGDASPILVTTAADLVANRELAGCAALLVTVFKRLLAAGAIADPGCRGKTAIARALVATGHDDAVAYGKGNVHFQDGPSWVKPEECAAGPRWHCAVGPVRSRHADAAVAGADFLADQHPTTREAAARADSMPC